MNKLPSISYVALDFSLAMHQLAAARLASRASRHFLGEGGMKDASCMTIDEQGAVLAAAGFDPIDQLLLKGGLVLHRASLPWLGDKRHTAS